MQFFIEMFCELDWTMMEAVSLTVAEIIELSQSSSILDMSVKIMVFGLPTVNLKT